MEDLSKLTPAEQEEYKQLKAELEPEVVQENGLTASEQAEYESLKAELEPEEKTSKLQSAALGAVEAVPFAKDALAAAETLYDGGTENFGERFTNNQKEWNESINKAESDNPITFNVADLATSVAATGPFGTGIKAAAALGAASSLSRSENRKASDVFIGGALGAVSTKVAPSLKYISEKLGIVKTQFGQAAVLSGNVKSSDLNRLNNHVNKFYNKFGKKTAQEATESFVDDIMNLKVDKDNLISSLDTPENIVEKASRLKQITDIEIGNILSKADEKLVKGVDTEVVLNKIKSSTELSKLLNSDYAPLQKEGAKILQELNDTFLEKSVKNMPEKLKNADGSEVIASGTEVVNGFKEFSLTKLHKLKLDMSSKLSANNWNTASDNLPVSKQELKERVAIISNIINDTVDSLGLDKVTKNSFKDANRRWANAHVVEKFAKQSSELAKPSWYTDLYKQLNFRSVTATLGLSTITQDVPQAALIAMGISSVASNPRVAPTVARGLDNLQKHIANNPDSEIIKRILVGHATSVDSFRENLSSAMSEVNLMQNKVQRSHQDIMMKSDDIIQTLEHKDKAVADQFRKALKTNDKYTINTIVDSLSKLPGSEDYIESGLGIDGIVYSEEDKQKLADQLDSADISHVQRLKHKKALKDQGLIPQLQPDPNYRNINNSKGKKPLY